MCGKISLKFIVQKPQGVNKYVRDDNCRATAAVWATPSVLAYPTGISSVLKAWKKIETAKQRSEEILRMREQNERRVVERISAAEREVNFTYTKLHDAAKGRHHKLSYHTATHDTIYFLFFSWLGWVFSEWNGVFFRFHQIFLGDFSRTWSDNFVFCWNKQNNNYGTRDSNKRFKTMRRRPGLNLHWL